MFLPFMLNKRDEHRKRIRIQSLPHVCKELAFSGFLPRNDPELLFNGYQANFDIIEQGLFYFTHEKGGCGSTMILKAEMFFSLFTGTKYEKNQNLSEECPRYCHDRRKLNRCQVHCESAFIREICQILEDRSLRN